MKRKLTKAVTALLTFSMLLSVASCAKNKSESKSNSGKKISDDTPWYDAEMYEVEQGLDPNKETEYAFSRFVGSDDKYVILLTNGNYKMPDNIDWENYNYADYSISVISVIDRATKKTVKNIDLNKELNDSEYAENARYLDGKLTLIYTSYDTTTWEMAVKEKDIDLESGNVIGTRDVDSPGVFQRSFKVGEYTVESEAVWNTETSYFILNIYSPDGSKQQVEIKDERKNVFEVSAVIPLSEDKALVIAYVENGNGYYELDLKSGKLTETDSKDYEWLDLGIMYNTLNGPDGNVYYTTPAGISKIDMKKKPYSQSPTSLG